MAVIEANNALFEEVRMSVEQYANHPYLVECGISQPISRFIFDVALAVLQKAEVPSNDVEPLLQALLLLQAGLSIHDEVDRKTDVLQQLSVLSGDYDCSRYYWILAKHGQSELLARLCRAVARINEAKMALCEAPKTVNTSRYLELKEAVAGELLFALADCYSTPARDLRFQVHSVVKAFVISEVMQQSEFPATLSFRQACERLSDAVEKILRLPSNAVIQPLSSFFLEYLTPIKQALENQTLAEGNR